LTAFSQTDTDSIPKEKCFPVPVVKMIVKDLLSGDSAKAQLKLTEEQLVQTENKVVVKDSVINKMLEKEVNYLTIIDDERGKYDKLDKYTKKLETDLEIKKIKSKFTNIISGGIILILGVILCLK
jgi:hypothetical protein